MNQLMRLIEPEITMHTSEVWLQRATDPHVVCRAPTSGAAVFPTRGNQRGNEESVISSYFDRFPRS